MISSLGKPLSRLAMGFLTLALNLSTAQAGLKVQVTSFRLVIGGTSTNEKIFYEAALRPADASSLWTPELEEFEFSIQVPTSAGDMVTAYKTIVPAGGLAPTGSGWALNDAGRTASGLVKLMLTKNSDGSLSLELTAVHAAVPSLDYRETHTFIRIGDDPGSSANSLSPSGSTWALNG